LRTPGVGCRTFLKILDTLQPEQLFFESFAALQALGLSTRSIDAIRKPNWEGIAGDLNWLDSPGNLAITLNDAAYPAQLKEIADPPPILFVRGKPQLLQSPQIAIVGSRNPTSDGAKIAHDFAANLTQAGFTITSGMALGIDAASHQGALDAQGFTIAVAGTGLDRVYPACHKQLATDIVASGAMVSEFPPGTMAKANHFPRRNRIISGLSQGLLVVEAAAQSGSLISARMALEQNREVFAIPGSIHNPLARGCNALIREGAKLVETTQHILEELKHYNQHVNEIPATIAQTMLDLEQQKLLNLILYSPTSVDHLVSQSGQSVEIIASMLLLLELQGCITSAPGGGYMRIK
jgi:DNA processing protein